MRRRPPVEELIAGVLAGDRTRLAQAITLVESSRVDDGDDARLLIDGILPRSGSAVRVGVSGIPGVGKSTFLDQFGVNLIAAGRRPAVLAVDPTSSRTGGSILGDKTRMERLSVAPESFIRPSPAGRALGGVNRVTRESILLCEAAGFDTVLVETVGVGQSETAVADMVDCFVLLMIPGAGDDLQGIKKGIVELADIIAVNKSDGDGAHRADLAAAEYRHALHLLSPDSPHWSTPVLTCSGRANIGLDELWDQILLHRERMLASGEFESRRSAQRLRWMWGQIDDRWRDAVRGASSRGLDVHQLEADVASGELGVSRAVELIWGAIWPNSTP